MNEDNLLNKIKTIFLVFLTFLVFVNTVILISVIPALGNYFTPHSQEAIAAWAIVRLTMESCMVAIIMLGVAYGTVKTIEWSKKRREIVRCANWILVLRVLIFVSAITFSFVSIGSIESLRMIGALILSVWGFAIVGLLFLRYVELIICRYKGEKEND